MTTDPAAPSLNRDIETAREFLPYLEAFLLLRAAEFRLTPGAVVLVLADVRRMAIDRRSALGKALAEIASTPPEPDPPNPRHVKPIPKRRRITP